MNIHYWIAKVLLTKSYIQLTILNWSENDKIINF